MKLQNADAKHHNCHVTVKHEKVLHSTIVDYRKLCFCCIKLM